MTKKPILCLDFDGCLHSYSSGWKGAGVIPDPPVPGAMRFVAEAVNHFDVQIFSSRSSDPAGIPAMREWMLRRLVEEFQGDGQDIAELIVYPMTKPVAFLTIDDRTVLFDGDWSAFDPKTLLDFSDQGKIQIGVARDEKSGCVIINFGKPTVWIGFPYEQAAELARVILKNAGKLN